MGGLTNRRRDNPHRDRITRAPSKFLAGSALAVLTLVVGVSCGGTSQAPTHSQTLIVENQFVIDSLDPGRGALQTSVLVDKSVYDTLLTVNPGDYSKPYPALASSFDQSADAKTFTFHIRQGTKFASGDPVTAADAVFSFTRLPFTGAATSAAGLMTGLTVTAPDPSTVVITSATSNPAIPMYTTQSNMGIIDSKLAEQNGATADKNDKGEAFLAGPNMAGAGPYMMTSVDPTSQIILKANPHYWGTKPAYNTIILRNVPPATQRLDVQDGQAGVGLNISPQDADSLSSASTVNVAAAASMDYFMIAMNRSASVSKLTSDPNFREAIRYAIDYQALIKLAGKGAIQSTGLVPHGVLGALPSSDNTQRDLARARADLAKVGVANPSLNMIYGTDLLTDGVSMKPLAETIQSNLKDIGITVNLVGQPFTENVANAGHGNVAMWLFSNTTDWPDPSDYGQFPPGTTLGLWFNWPTGMDPNVDSLYAQATSATDRTQRNGLFQQFQQAMNATDTYVFLVQPGRNLVTAKAVHATPNPFDLVDFGSIS